MRLVYNNFKLLMEDMVRDALPGYRVHCKTTPAKNIMNGELSHIGVFPQFVDVLFINKEKEYGVALVMQNLYKIYQQSSGIEEVIEIVKKAVSETMENPDNFVQKAAEKCPEPACCKKPMNVESLRQTNAVRGYENAPTCAGAVSRTSYNPPAEMFAESDELGEALSAYTDEDYEFKPVESSYSCEQKNGSGKKSYSLNAGLDGAPFAKANFASATSAACAEACLKICNHVKSEDVYRKFFDMYIVYCNESGNVTKAMLSASKMSEEELYNRAAENSARKHPMTFTKIEQGKYLLTTQNITNGAAAMLYPGGAAAMLYPGVLKKISEELDDDLYIAPVSDKFVFIWKKSGKKDVKAEMQKYYDMMEKLYGLSKFSECILHYHKDSGILTPLDSPVYKI